MFEVFYIYSKKNKLVLKHEVNNETLFTLLRLYITAYHSSMYTLF